MFDKLCGLGVDKDLSEPEKKKEFEALSNFVAEIFEQADGNGDG